jgi:hypothetical protein
MPSGPGRFEPPGRSHPVGRLAARRDRTGAIAGPDRYRAGRVGEPRRSASGATEFGSADGAVSGGKTGGSG